MRESKYNKFVLKYQINKNGGCIMRRHTKIIALLLMLAMLLVLVAGCNDNGDANPETSGESQGEAQGGTEGVGIDTPEGEIEITFWSAPEQYNLDIWNKYAEKFNETNTQVGGKTVSVKVQQMPAQPSSEAGIQNAIATGTTPVLSENINRSFAATLANAEAIHDLNQEDWFKSIVSERAIDTMMDSWVINEAQYVLPLYINPIVYVWNSKALKELGFTDAPKTVTEFNDALKKFSEQKDALNDIGITHFMYRHELTRPDAWWERWFDFESQYNAFSQNKGFVEGDTLVLDRDAAKKVFDLYGSIGNSLITGEIPGIWQEQTVPVVVGIGMPWEVAPNKAAGKTYGLEGDYIFGPTLVENEDDTHYNFADSKGIVLYKTQNITEEQYKGAVEFMKYVFIGDGKDTFDVDWLDITSMLPVRGDLETNDILKAYFDENIEMKAISAYVKDGVPCMANEKMPDILTVLAEKGLTPYITGKVSNANIDETPDSSSYVDAAIEAMKEELER